MFRQLSQASRFYHHRSSCCVANLLHASAQEHPGSCSPRRAGQMEVEIIVNIHADSDDYVTEVVDVTGGSDEEDLVEVKAGEPPRYFHGYRRGRELGRGASGQVFVCHKKGTEGGFAAGFAVKAVDLRRLHLQPNAEREEKKLSREVEILKRLPPHPNIVQQLATTYLSISARRHRPLQLGGCALHVLAIDPRLLSRLVDTFEEGEWFLLVLELVGGGDLYTAPGQQDNGQTWNVE